MSVVEVVEGRGKLGLHECNVSNVSNVKNSIRVCERVLRGSAWLRGRG